MCFQCDFSFALIQEVFDSTLCSMIINGVSDNIRRVLMCFSQVGAVALGDHLYVCGGFDGISSLDTVER